jgi:hypothetical protein
MYIRKLSDSDLLAEYYNLRDELSDLDSEDDFDQYSGIEFALDEIESEIERRGL